MAPVLCRKFHRDRSERHVLQAPGQKHVQEMARADIGRVFFCDQRAPLRHSQQKAARRGRTRDSMPRIGIASRQTTRCFSSGGEFLKKSPAALKSSEIQTFSVMRCNPLRSLLLYLVPKATVGRIVEMFFVPGPVKNACEVVPYKNRSNLRCLLQVPCNYLASTRIGIGIFLAA